MARTLGERLYEGISALNGETFLDEVGVPYKLRVEQSDAGIELIADYSACKSRCTGSVEMVLINVVPYHSVKLQHLAQTSPSRTEPQESRTPLSNLESQPTIHGSEEVCQEGTDYG